MVFEPFVLTTDPPKIYDPVGRCIYCSYSPDDGSTALGDEHIIPFSLNGTHVLPLASCRKCEKVTSYLDGFAARSIFYQIRTSARIRTRTKLPDTLPAILLFEDGHEERVTVPADIHPSVLALPKFAMPHLLSGTRPDGNFQFTIIRWQRASLRWDEFVKARGAKEGAVDCAIKPQQFSRVLAKIAHAYAVAKLGIDGFEPFLVDLIHQRNVVRAPELVGSEPEIPPPTSGVVHELDFIGDNNFVVVRIRLFASSSIDGAHGFPVYLVVAGQPIRTTSPPRVDTSRG